MHIARMMLGGRNTSGTLPAGGLEALANGLLNRNDANHDGKLSPAEMPGRMKQVFGHFDTNNYGFLDSEELKVLAERVQAVHNRRNKPAS